MGPYKPPVRDTTGCLVQLRSMTPMHKSEAYVHRPDPERPNVFDSICLFCFLTVAVGTLEELRQAEQEHLCHKKAIAMNLRTA